MKLSEMKQFLAGGNIRLSKSLGQNFLHDGNQLRRIVAAGELTASDRVLEIGPGLGPLTDLLLARVGNVLAVEKDRRLVDVLRQRFHGEGNDATRVDRRLKSPQTNAVIELDKSIHARKRLLTLGARRQERSGERMQPEYPASTPLPVPQAEGEQGPRSGDFLDSVAVGGGSAGGVRPKLLLVHDDALKFLRRESRDWSDWKMVSNLPYSAASPVLVELAQATACPERMVVTVQREVAQRIIANPGDEDYGLLTLLIQLRYESHGWFKIPPDCFFPRPDVDSACVALLRRSKPLLNRDQAATFTKIVKRAFSQRRKMMLKLLREDWPQDWLSRWFRAGGLATEVRAERVGLNEFVRLAELLHADQNSCHG